MIDIVRCVEILLVASSKGLQVLFKQDWQFEYLDTS